MNDFRYAYDTIKHSHDSFLQFLKINLLNFDEDINE